MLLWAIWLRFGLCVLLLYFSWFWFVGYIGAFVWIWFDCAGFGVVFVVWAVFVVLLLMLPVAWLWFSSACIDCVGLSLWLAGCSWGSLVWCYYCVGALFGCYVVIRCVDCVVDLFAFIVWRWWLMVVWLLWVGVV